MTDTLGGGFDANLFAPPRLNDSMASGLAGRSVAEWMRWRGEWVEGVPYKRHDVVRSGEWLMVCTTEQPLGTYEPAAILPTGLLTDVYQGTMGTNQQTVKQITIGQRYVWVQDGFLTGVRVYTVTGNSYSVWTIVDGAVVRELAEFDGVTTGWQDVPIITQEPVAAGRTFDVLVIIAEPDPTPVEVPASYNYITPNNNDVPLDGQCVHANLNLGTLRVAHTDADLVDRQALLESLAPGDIISTTTGDWAVQAVSPEATWVDIAVAPALQQGIDGVRVLTFQTTDPTPVTYGEDAGHWAGNANVTGLIAVDGGIGDVVETDDAYGVDVAYQEAIIPTEWELMARSR